ncbi:hypothetical protein NL676_014104 [Syzygium grande]|nr:hypothetical protein NL676_014104 [Syzygium grande]
MAGSEHCRLASGNPLELPMRWLACHLSSILLLVLFAITLMFRAVLQCDFIGSFELKYVWAHMTTSADLQLLHALLRPRGSRGRRDRGGGRLRFASVSRSRLLAD